MLDFIGMKQVCNNMFLFLDKSIGFIMNKVILEDIKKIVFLISFIITKIVRTHKTIGFMSSFFVL